MDKLKNVDFNSGSNQMPRGTVSGINAPDLKVNPMNDDVVKLNQQYLYQREFYNDPDAQLFEELREVLTLESNSIAVVGAPTDPYLNREQYEESVKVGKPILPSVKSTKTIEDEKRAFISKYPTPVCMVGANAPCKAKDYVYFKQAQPASRLFYYKGVLIVVFDVYSIAGVIKYEQKHMLKNFVMLPDEVVAETPDAGIDN